jgi:hypothetical protein
VCRAEGSRRHTPTGKVLVFSEDVLKQFRSAVGNFRQIGNISRSCYGHSETHDASDLVERSEMLTRHGKRVERSEARCLAACFDIKLRAYATDE